MEPQNNRKQTEFDTQFEDLIDWSESVPDQETESSTVMIPHISEPATVIEWDEPRRPLPTRRDGDFTPFLEIKRRDEMTEAVKAVAIGSAELVGVGVFLVGRTAFTVVKYVMIGVATFVVEVIKIVFRLSTKKATPFVEDDKPTFGPSPTGGINVTTNVFASGNATVNIQNQINLK